MLKPVWNASGICFLAFALAHSLILTCSRLWYEIVASFKLEKPMSSLQDNMGQLEADILDEIEVLDAEVVILSLKSSYGSNSNVTSVVFEIDLETKDPSLSIAAQALDKFLFVFLSCFFGIAASLMILISSQALGSVWK
ncbi:hypothetical protein Droror1_Dr00018451 [Drosera rotundifolia]